jgi:hypothetical protein
MIFSKNRYAPIGSKPEGMLFPDHALVASVVSRPVDRARQLNVNVIYIYTIIG